MSTLCRGFLCALAFLALAWVVPILQAQPPAAGSPQRRPAGGAMFDPTLMLLRSEQVQKELDLVDDQKVKLRELGEQLRDEVQKLFAGAANLTPEERRQRMTEAQEKLRVKAEEARKKVEEILLPHQMDRLKQLGLQSRGAAALAEPKVVEELRLTDEQKQRLAKLREQFDATRRSWVEGINWREMSQEDRQRKMDELREKMEKATREASDEAMNVLTLQQRETFEKMKGKKVDLSGSAFGGLPRFRGNATQSPRQ